jgi:hypothetical protein
MNITSSQPLIDATRTSQVLAQVTDYAEAQRIVDRLADAGFPVEHVRIVGTGIHSVEQVTGRLTRLRATAMGAGSGAWFGVFLGLLFGLFTVGNTWFAMLFAGLAIGAFWGGVFGLIAHWATGGRRDFSSFSTMRAASYAVEVDSEVAVDAARITAGL